MTDYFHLKEIQEWDDEHLLEVFQATAWRYHEAVQQNSQAAEEYRKELDLLKYEIRGRMRRRNYTPITLGNKHQWSALDKEGRPREQ